MRPIDEDRIYKQSIIVGGTTTITILCILIFLVSLCSCGVSHKAYPPQQIDSIYIHKVDTLVLKDTTILVKMRDSIVYQQVKDSSHLETDLAHSDAWVDTLGILHHKLQNKADLVPIKVDMPKAISREVRHHFSTITKNIEIEKKLKWWEEGLMWLGKIFAMIISVLIIYRIIIWRFKL